MSTKLIKKSSEGVETFTLWVDGGTLHWLRAFSWVRPSEGGKKNHGKPDKAAAALDARVAELLAGGYAHRDAAPARAATKTPRASGARVVEKPVWLSHEGLASHRKKLAAASRKAGLSHRLDEIEALSRPAIQLAVKKASRAPSEVVSRIGGDPDLAARAVWPEHAKKPLQFVAQIVLEDVYALDLEGILPSAGVLAFFAQLDERRDDYAEIARVLHGAGKPERRTPPAPSGIQAVGLLTPRLLLTLPYYEDPVVDALKLTDDERTAYHDEVFLALLPDSPRHLLLGYPSAGTEHGLEGRRLLAQLDADDRIGFAEGDDQPLRIYFANKKNDLASVVCTLEEA